MKPQNLIAFTAWIALAGCAGFKPDHGDVLQNTLPENYTQTGGEETRDSQWWKSFESPELNQLMDEALGANLNLAQYAARLQQKQALAQKAGAVQLPSVSGTASAGSTWSDITKGNKIDAFSLGLSASYELDLWNRVHSTAEAALRTSEASAMDLQSAAMSLSANLANTWLSIMAQQEKIALIQAQIETNTQILELLKLRQRNAQSTAMDVLQQEQAVATVRTLLPPAELQLGLLESQLAVLMGRPAGAAPNIKTTHLPNLPPLPDVGLPADLLAARPDIRANQLRLESADWSVAAARANQLPTLTLSGSLSASDNQLADVLDQWAGNLLAGLTAPLFDAGTRKAEVTYQQALAQEQVAAYRETVLNAITEVDDALLTEKKTAEQLSAEEVQLQSLTANLDEAQFRYRKGQVTYLTVLNAQTSKQSVERSLIATRLALCTARIELYRALGGNAFKTINPTF